VLQGAAEKATYFSYRIVEEFNGAANGAYVRDTRDQGRAQLRLGTQLVNHVLEGAKAGNSGLRPDAIQVWSVVVATD
jgi:hypothetical protein